MTTTLVEGFVAPGFEKVRDVVASRPAAFGRGGGAIAAYVDGELVVDLWGGQARPNQAWTSDTLALVASVTKAWAAIIVAGLAEEGLLDYVTPIANWWPEFAQNGKGSITLHDVFLHSNGVLGFEDQVAFLEARDGAGWLDLDGIAQRLASARPAWVPGTRHGYHAVSYGWLLNEVVRRVAGETIGHLFAERIAGPLELDSYLGTPASEQARVARILLPDLDAASPPMRRLLKLTRERGSDPSSLAGRALLGDGSTTLLDRVDAAVRTPNFLLAEIPASNGCSNARSLAKLFMTLAAGGTLDGHQILKPETLMELRSIRAVARDSVMTSSLPRVVSAALPRARYTYGLSPSRLRPRHMFAAPDMGTFVSQGYGGQLVMGDPSRRLSFASVFSDFTPGLDKRLQRPVLDVLYECIA